MCFCAQVVFMVFYLEQQVRSIPLISKSIYPQKLGKMNCRTVCIEAPQFRTFFSALKIETNLNKQKISEQSSSEDTLFIVLKST